MPTTDVATIPVAIFKTSHPASSQNAYNSALFLAGFLQFVQKP
ncbi:hypothetical protein CHCC20348_0005 [Bacillus paralicheniformis]|uniref:Uncharacterized protein n=1 Tax=Bacillus paralicheniformis TaxID=1648923 RepID=A0ABY3FYL5_9BACI|nr:hypothetical protein CHCC20348_0005 [Bacillus paralicheniformis]TWL42091.1 hypothetical protein CHCC15381_4699 [Bacillus paralicheniformis]